ncbi:MAG TPA: hypothetical protein VHY22_19150 [Chthoniobacteraceae bacterium]|jgi:hypothetical protein|nr:hypothetical protein [Chthoniobacteraceae bacterium]
MKQIFYGLLFIIGLALMIDYFRPAPPPPVIVVATPTPPPPPPVPTPNPAKGAIQAAVQMYPDLEKKGSTFNLMFIDDVDHRKKSEPASLVPPRLASDRGG